MYLGVIFQNLDVNLAVNNLLSRDDEGEDEEGEGGDPYMSGECVGTESILKFSFFLLRIHRKCKANQTGERLCYKS